MPDSQDAHLAVLVIYLVDNAVVTYSHPPVSVRPGQLAATGRPGIVGEDSQRRDYAAEHDAIEAT